MSEFYSDPERITYPEADRIVDEYVAARGAQRARTTSRDVLGYGDVPNNAHNQRRVHDALSRRCEPLEANWAGRTVFQLPNDTEP